MVYVPAYMRIRQFIIDLLIEHPDPALRIMTERELSVTFSVSRTTVRTALRDLVNEGFLVVRRGRGHGMFPNPTRLVGARLMRSQRKVVLLVGDGKISYIDGFFMRLVAEIFLTLQTHPVRVQLLNLVEPDDRIVDELRSYSPAGVIWLRPPRARMAAIQRIRRDCPVQLVAVAGPGDPANARVDLRAAGRLAAAWFLDQGVRDPLFIGYRPENTMRGLYDGWEEEFVARGGGCPVERRFEGSIELDRQLTAYLGAHPVRGLFATGQHMPGVAAAFTATPGFRRADYRILCDDSPLVHQADLEPDALIRLVPPELTRAAALNLLAMMADPDFVSCEQVFAPSIATPTIDPA